MTPSLKYLIAEYLQINGPQSSAELADRFTENFKIVNMLLGEMEKKNYIKGSSDRVKKWAFLSLPPKIRSRLGGKKVKTQTFHAGFNRPDLCSIASLPLVRI